MGKTVKIGEQLKNRFIEMIKKHVPIGKVQGIRAILAIEFVKNIYHLKIFNLIKGRKNDEQIYFT